MSSKTNVIGEAINRIDGILKVTGTANYAMDFPINNVAYGFLLKAKLPPEKFSRLTRARRKKPTA